MLRSLLGQGPPEEAIASDSGDSAYDTKGCNEPIALRQADVIIPTRKTAKLWETNCTGAKVRNEILRATRRLARTIR